MPRVAQYRAQSVIYFEGDKSETIFILQSGKVSLNNNDIETGEPIRNRVAVGEFFGVNSALGKYPRSEDALALSDTSVVVLSVSEFESFCINNPQIAIKMLKVFSTELRKIHVSVRSLMHDEHLSDPESGLFRSGEFYLAQQSFPYVVHALEKYHAAYPSGRFISTAREYLNQSLEALGRAPAQGASSGKDPTAGQELSSQLKEELETGKKLFQNNDMKSASRVFRRILDADGKDTTFSNMARKFYGQCLYHLKEYENAIKVMSQYVQSNREDPEVSALLYYIGDSYLHVDEQDRAKAFLQRAKDLAAGKNEQLEEKVVQALSSIGA